MDARSVVQHRRPSLESFWPRATSGAAALLDARFLGQLAAVFIAYYVAGKLGQATTNVRSNNIGTVWPAFGIALASMISVLMVP